MKVSVLWMEGLKFEGTGESGNSRILFDSADTKIGGEGSGPSPKQAFLQSIAGCTGMDVVYILERMRATMPRLFRIEIDSEIAEKDPKVFTGIRMVYHVEGETERNKLLKAVKLSQETYCSISNMVKQISDLRFAVILNNEEIYSK